jgi:hypothetical protein
VPVGFSDDPPQILLHFICAWDEPGTRVSLNHGVKTQSPQSELMMMMIIIIIIIITIFLAAIGF